MKRFQARYIPEWLKNLNEYELSEIRYNFYRTPISQNNEMLVDNYGCQIAVECFTQ